MGMLVIEKTILLLNLRLGCIFVVLTFASTAFSASLPAAPDVLASATNCTDVRSGSIIWNTSRDALMTEVVAKQSAIDETLLELVKQMAGIDIRNLTRSDLHMENDTLSDRLQIASFAKIKGRILDYKIANIKRSSEAKLNRYQIELSGRVCADNIVDEPMVVALRNSQNLPRDLLRMIESELSRNISAYPKIIMADNDASKTYNDIEINVEVSAPQSSIVDRSDAIVAIKLSLGENAAKGISQYVTRVELRMTMNATVHEDGSKLVAAHLVERDISGKQKPSKGIIAGMESEAAKKIAKDLSSQLAKHIKKLKMQP